ncbi:MAG: glucose 1-dehydrogenase [Lentisphaerae bacterium]|nr:glucose 1-dehydrogenase [Lentisphaerota bacterium]
MGGKESSVVIVTGGARGIGYGIGECFAAKGAAIVVADIKVKASRAAAKQLAEAGASDALGVKCDVADRSSVRDMVKQVLDRFGRIDVLVNNAGICPFIDVMDLTPGTWQKVLDVNLTGAFHCTQLVAKEMIKRKQKGRIVFITSLAENVAGPAQVDYAASKAGLRMTMRGFATALGPHGITCNAVAPGMILTDMTRHHWEQPGPAEFIKTRVPVGRIGTATDIGHAVVFLASPEADYISGVTLTVDGGHQACCV